MGKSIATVFLIAVLSIPVVTNAAIVTYVIESDLRLAGGSDLFSLDGARFTYTITADTSSAMLFASDYPPDGITAYYQSLSSSFYFSNRSNGASDATTSGTAPRLRAGNQTVTSSQYDNFEIDHSYLTGEFDGMLVTNYVVYFSPDFYLDDGIVQLPSSFNFNDAAAAYWGRFSFSDEISEIARYEPTNWSMSVSAVPIPAAFWLFGSGLIGLIGFARRK